MPQFPQGAPRGTPVRVCDEGPCVRVVRDSVRGDVGWRPQRCCSEGNRGLELVLFLFRVITTDTNVARNIIDNSMKMMRQRFCIWFQKMRTQSPDSMKSKEVLNDLLDGSRAAIWQVCRLSWLYVLVSVINVITDLEEHITTLKFSLSDMHIMHRNRYNDLYVETVQSSTNHI